MKRKMLSILLAGVMILTSFGADVVTADAAEINNTTNTVTVGSAAVGTSGTSMTTVSTATPKLPAHLRQLILPLQQRQQQVRLIHQVLLQSRQLR